MTKQKVIFHIDELGKWQLLIGNVSNLLKAVGAHSMDVEVLANAEAVCFFDLQQDFLLDRSSLTSLNEQGVCFAACNNALIANGVDANNLPQFVQVVPAGIVELINRQSEGYAYIRP